ncbi:hypothetical protein [Novosphingobium sp. Leaf2]|uniref:hypothetical protein n=1 Tax=Novosphingobium sp. Leaf2 TaxID=1735670 RepID=UPI0006F934C7|nr:hypothetical protein [Novosphingobium sp. Leaf2]KQM18390.1 terminase [Novosphingobium sp. Leaf2]
MATAADLQRELASDIGSFTHDPYRYALYAFPWVSPQLPDAGPRNWQRDVMQDIGAHLTNPETRYQPCRIAVASGHGIGKSALIAMLIKWGLDTCVDTRIVVTANTEGQLLTKTSPEIAKWCRLAITADWFKANATSIVSTMPGRDKGWRADLVTWSENNTEAFAGLHNQGKRLIVVFDEGSGISDKVWEVTLGALTDADTEIIWLAFGNPTLNTGAFRECFGKQRNLWKTRQIDSRTVEGTNKTYLQEIVDTYGEDSDIAKVRVRGMFPSASSMQFIGYDLVEAAQLREVGIGLGSDPLIYGLDCARFGDDESVLAKRCGRDAKSRPWKRWSKMDAMTLAADVALEAQKEHPDAILVDAGNIGGAVIDRLRQLLPDTPVMEVWFGGEGRDAELEPGVTIRTKNKRAQIWTQMRAWLRTGAIPTGDKLRDDLVGPLYSFDEKQAVALERKQDMKKRGLSSPDDGDALAVTFAEPIMPRQLPGYLDPINYGNGGNRYGELD